MLIVSACLAGVNCTYDGKNRLKKKIKKMVESGDAIAVCPEELGGLKTPRTRSEIIGGDGKDVLGGKAKVFTPSKKDVTKNFVRGAEKVLRIAKKHKITEAILKSKSPACGYGHIYDGSFTFKLKKGIGVTASILSQNGIAVMTEADI